MRGIYKCTAVLVVVSLSGPARAGTVLGTGGATEVTQLANMGQLLQQTSQLAQQLQYMQSMLASVQGFNWGATAADLAQLNQIVQKSGAIAYSAANLESQFAALYPGFTTYQAKNGLGLNGLLAKYTQWSQETNQSVLASLRAAGLQQSDFATEQATVTTLQQFSQSAAGQTAAVQAGNQILVALIGQLQKLRQLEMLSLQMHGDYMAAQADRESALRADMQATHKEATLPTNNGARY